MTIVCVNTVSFGSTGKIMLSIAQQARENGIEATTFSMKWRRQNQSIKGHRYYGSFPDNALHKVVGKITGRDGCYSFLSNLRFIRKLKEIKPDVIHLHNLHGYTINIPLLFSYIKKNNVKVVWTLHDCWAFTGHCPCFMMVGCNRWKDGCGNCPQYRAYPSSCFDNSRAMWKKKKKWFTGVSNMTIVTPSEWLAGLVQASFLKDYPLRVIQNGIDLSIFRPRSGNFRDRFGIKSRFMILGVAFGWGVRKGLDVFVELFRRLDPDQYSIVLVGTDEMVDKQLPNGIVSIHRTQNQIELAEIYSAADLFVNPTREDNYPTVNMEAIACGTPVLTFDTGGSPEMLTKKTGSVVPCDDIDALEKEIVRICRDRPYSEQDCVDHAKSFDMNERFEEYIKLYEDCAYSAERPV